MTTQESVTSGKFNTNRKGKAAMKAAQLETMANAILEGKLSVDGAERMLGGKEVHTATLGPAEATPKQAAHVRALRADAAMQYRLNKHNLRIDPTGDEDDVRAEVYGGQRIWPDQVTEGTFVNFMPRISESVQREQSPKTFDDAETLEQVAAHWELLEVARLRWPVVAFRPDYRDPSGTRKTLRGDAANGYLADETWIEGQSRLDAELRLPHSRVLRDWQRDYDGSILLDSDGSRLEKVEESIVMGATQWEYRRRSQGRQPWMDKRTFAWVNALDRDREAAPWMMPARTTHAQIMQAEKRRASEYRQLHRERAAKAQASANRSKLIGLIRELGGDPKAPDVAGWVKRVGITVALEKLLDRQAARV